jgi:hypothetical protein
VWVLAAAILFRLLPGISSFQIPENIAYCPEYCGNQAETAKKMSAILTKTKEVTLSSSFKL